MSRTIGQIIFAVLLVIVVVLGLILIATDRPRPKLPPLAERPAEPMPAPVAAPPAVPRPDPALAPVIYADTPAPPPAVKVEAPIVTSPLPAGRAVAKGVMPRIVGGPGISPGPVVGGSAEREEPAPAATRDEGWITFPSVLVVSAGLIDLGGHTVALAGIEVPADGSTCRNSADGAAIDCARASTTALRQRIRTLGVQCRPAAGSGDMTTSAACRIGTTDLSLWLIEQGWAGAGKDAPEAYRLAETSARCGRAGVWAGVAPPADCPAR